MKSLCLHAAAPSLCLVVHAGLCLLFACLSNIGNAAEPPARVQDGLQALYDFGSEDGNLVKDLSGNGQRHDLRIADPKSVRHSSAGLEVIGKTLIHTDRPPARLIESIKQSGEITIEA